MRKWLFLALAIAAIIILCLFWVAVAAHLATFGGFNNGGGNGSHYLFFSGAGGLVIGNILQPAIIGAAIIYYRKNNCKRTWCWRLGKHDFTDPTDGVCRLLCWKHHPDVKHKSLDMETIRKIQEKRHLHLGERPGKG
jgi:hypothetical protein